MGKTWVYPESVIPYSIFRYIEKGKAELCIDGVETIVEENQIVYIPQGCKMSCRALSEAFEFYSLRFVSAKYCYAAHESRLHQNDRCKRFALCLVLTVRFRSLAPWGKLFQLFI